MFEDLESSSAGHVLIETGDLKERKEEKKSRNNFHQKYNINQKALPKRRRWDKTITS